MSDYQGITKMRRLARERKQLRAEKARVEERHKAETRDLKSFQADELRETNERLDEIEQELESWHMATLRDDPEAVEIPLGQADLYYGPPKRVKVLDFEDEPSDTERAALLELAMLEPDMVRLAPAKSWVQERIKDGTFTVGSDGVLISAVDEETGEVVQVPLYRVDVETSWSVTTNRKKVSE